ncbi:MAG TPA: ribosome small subunit-dependent GTPase A [Dokdonella sp.]|uniref:ribosome small subunit-dependent GTPase A n=1 Tax=Dokdonella sp. TaxID=2291710 RepID=UPI002D7EF8E4|nr:ribosome small subunit-dependent GTPase A [Dokdonella sp.]HET9031663.1 ribosome small subunit-dependent GTPase A [Dokdonella sp.]
MSEPSESLLAHIGWRGELPKPPADQPGLRVARVIAQHRAGYELHDGDHAFNAQPAPRFIKPGIDPCSRPAVGDFVMVTSAKPPMIERILPRRSELARAAAGERHLRQLIATNIDTVMIISGLDGDFNPSRIERYLMLVEGSGAKAVVVLTKADTSDAVESTQQELRKRVSASTAIHAINAKSADSIGVLSEYFGPGTSTVLVGSSGVGKSTLTNTLLGETRQATNAVRETDSRGRHTTTYRALIQLPSGGCLIDTPGMREIKLTGEETLDGDQFGDIEELAQTCRFGDCSHLSEPACAVRAALEDGRLDNARWHNYLKLRDELSVAADSLETQLRRKTENRVLTKSLSRRSDEKFERR